MEVDTHGDEATQTAEVSQVESKQEATQVEVIDWQKAIDERDGRIAELQRTQVAPEADAFTFAQIASHEGVASTTEDLSEAEAVDLLASLRSVTSRMDEAQVTAGTPPTQPSIRSCAFRSGGSRRWQTISAQSSLPTCDSWTAT